jgi:hypothetical protein
MILTESTNIAIIYNKISKKRRTGVVAGPVLQRAELIAERFRRMPVGEVARELPDGRRYELHPDGIGGRYSL